MALHEIVRPQPYCYDSQTGIARCEGMDGDGLDTSRLGGATYRVIAQDGSGRSANREFEYNVVDVQAPTVTLRAPTNGAEYALGQKVIADYDCADEADGSGVATCSGAVPKGSALDTTAIGQHGFSVRTSDHAGNERTVYVTYSVCAAPQLDVLPDPIGGPVHAANCGS